MKEIYNRQNEMYHFSKRNVPKIKKNETFPE